ncbi:MAG: carboxypeptidase regulatory-like domain-containing protein [Firmicutes bacterium]|nr:carboxypeptidase regulatory-like domain-containing protein [Bacillota bacterium]
MYDPQFWRRFRKLGFLTVLLILGGLYAAVAFYTLIPNLAASRFDTTKARAVVSGFLPAADRGIIESFVCDIFGNPIPNAKVKVMDAEVATDSQGKFRIENVPLGQVNLEISAVGFHSTKVTTTIEPGINYPHIKFDTGMHPQEFYVRFHAFTNSLEDTDTRLLFGLVEVVNPSNDPMYVSRIEVKDPSGQVVYDLLESWEILQLVKSTYDLEVVMEPLPAYVIAPKSSVVFELDALPDPLRGSYHLWLAYSSPANHRKGRMQALHIVDEMDYDPNLDPHIVK